MAGTRCLPDRSRGNEAEIPVSCSDSRPTGPWRNDRLLRRTLESRDEIGLESPEPTDWSDPDRCPFCGESIIDGGPSFVEHVESADDCAVAFARWREGVAGDVAGEWVA